ncbi:MAG: TIM barrel protein, partial [Methanomassiliicoccales archaeon]|nr:TIM barrel protein [Methanomassiliicoccales archaeon]
LPLRRLRMPEAGIRQGLIVSRCITCVVFYVGPAGYPIGSKNPIDALERVRGLGFNALEVEFVRQARMDEGKARSIGSKAEELGILLSAHAPYYVNFNSVSRATVNKSVEWVVKTARIADLMGAWVIVIHAASYSGRSPEAATKAVIRGLKRCRVTMEEEGLRPMLGLETMGRKGTWGTLREIRDVMEDVGGSIPVLDFGHLHARDGGRFRSVADFQGAMDEVESMYEGDLHCHFSCIEYSGAGEIRHLPLEAKEPDFSLLAKVLRTSRKNVTVISETPLPEKGALRMKRILAIR